jgi:predicted PurR-regulated permease PerM
MSLLNSTRRRRPRLTIYGQREDLIVTEPRLISPDHRPGWNATMKVVVAVILFVLFVLAIYAFRVVFVPLIIGLIMAYLLQPVVRLIQRTTRLSRGLTTGLLYLILLALAVPLGIILIPTAIDQIIYLQRQVLAFARYLNNISAETSIHILGIRFGVQDLVRQITAGLTGFVTSAATGSLGFVLDAARIIALGVFTLVIGFYLTRDAGQVLNWLRGLIPPTYQSDGEMLLAEMDQVWASFFRGQLLLSLIVAVILTVLSAVLGLPKPLLLGIWGGLLEFMPSIGNMVWGLTAVIVALAAGSTYLPLPNVLFALIVFGAYVAFAQVEVNVLLPNIIGRHVRLHPVVVILGVIIGASVGGVLGVALAAPTIATLRIMMRYLYANLFDLDPFPMVGAPTASKEERQAEAERLIASAGKGSSTQ